jgi:nitrile hydratase
MADDPHSHSHEHGSELSDLQLRVRALETILTEKGYIDPAALDQIVEACETKIEPHNGARVVARAWVDPDFKRRLLEDATEAANSLGHISPVGAHLIAVENTPSVHNLVVCTLCSCYPWRSWARRRSGTNRRLPLARGIDPKGVLGDFGVKLPAETQIRIWGFDRRDPLPGGCRCGPPAPS